MRDCLPARAFFASPLDTGGEELILAVCRGGKRLMCRDSHPSPEVFRRLIFKIGLGTTPLSNQYFVCSMIVLHFA